MLVRRLQRGSLVTRRFWNSEGPGGAAAGGRRTAGPWWYHVGFEHFLHSSNLLEPYIFEFITLAALLRIDCKSQRFMQGDRL